MTGQYLPQTNESATVPVLQNFLELNKALAKLLESVRFFGQAFWSSNLE